MSIHETETAGSQFRVEEDTLGEVQVPADYLRGAQTQRSRINFPIGVERFRWDRPVIRALGILKKCAALANSELGQLPKEMVDLIVSAAQEVIDGRWDGDAACRELACVEHADRISTRDRPSTGSATDP